MTLATAGKSGEVTARVVLMKSSAGRVYLLHKLCVAQGQTAWGKPYAALVFIGRICTGRCASKERSNGSAVRSLKPISIPGRGYLRWLQLSRNNPESFHRKGADGRFQTASAITGRSGRPLTTKWGGYRLIPETIEFWRHRDNRLHDRIRYRRMEGGIWGSEYLAP